MGFHVWLRSDIESRGINLHFYKIRHEFTTTETARCKFTQKMQKKGGFRRPLVAHTVDGGSRNRCSSKETHCHVVIVVGDHTVLHRRTPLLHTIVANERVSRFRDMKMEEMKVQANTNWKQTRNAPIVAHHGRRLLSHTATANRRVSSFRKINMEENEHGGKRKCKQTHNGSKLEKDLK